jgi:integrase
LPIQKNPQCPVSIGQGLTLEYRRCKGPGRWVVKVADGRGKNWERTLQPVADDFEQADGENILNFWQACDKARALARGGRGGRPETLAEALDSYQQDLIARGGDVENASRLRLNLPPQLLSKPVALLAVRDLRGWRDGLLRAGMKGATVARTAKAFRACHYLAARSDKRIANRDIWRDVRIADIPDSFNVRNVILEQDQIRAIVVGAYSISPGFGLWVETHAATGARTSQIAALQIADLQDGRADPRLMMPPSKKGKKKDRARKPVPVAAGLARKLRAAAGARPPTDPLLLCPGDLRWRRLFVTTAKRAGIEGVTIYSLRHSRAVHMILAGVPLRLVASILDTSTMMLEKTYSANIASHADEVARRGLIDFGEVPSTDDNIVSLPRRS